MTDAAPAPPLLSIKDCADPARTAALSARERETLDVLRGWIKAFLMSAHPELGRVGDVCPFTGHAARLDTIRLGVSDAGPADPTRLKAVGAAMFRDFGKIPCEPKARLFRTIIVAFPNCDSAEGIAVLKRVAGGFRLRSVLSARMIALFHPGHEAPGLWNPRFRPMRAPIPIFVIRQLVENDAPFAARHLLLAPAYLRRFPIGGARRFAALARRRLMGDARPAKS